MDPEDRARRTDLGHKGLEQSDLVRTEALATIEEWEEPVVPAGSAEQEGQEQTMGSTMEPEQVDQFGWRRRSPVEDKLTE